MPLVSAIYLGGVIAAFTTFATVLGRAAYYQYDSSLGANEAAAST